VRKAWGGYAAARQRGSAITVETPSRRAAILFTLVLPACQASAPSANVIAGDLRITDGFAYEPIIQASGAAYFTVRNTGSVPDTLLGISSPAASGAMLHGGTMAHLSVVEIPAGGTVTLKSGDTHIMLSDFITMPRAGDSLPVTVEFAHAGSVTLQLPVRKYGE
jgi:periplasmic copper chaperone A